MSTAANKYKLVFTLSSFGEYEDSSPARHETQQGIFIMFMSIFRISAVAKSVQKTLLIISTAFGCDYNDN